jgi:hypothetical protein
MPKNIAITIILVVSMIAIVGLQPIWAQGTNKLDVLNLQVSPGTIKVGDMFSINATLVNNSTDTITVHNGCGGAFSVVFDNHATVNLKKICNWMAVQIILKPGQNTTVTSQYSNLEYNATSSGAANANVTFSYDTLDQSTQVPSGNNTISKSLSFTIHDKNYQTNVGQTVMPPLEQFRSGIAADSVQCKYDLELIFKSSDDSPACVTSPTAIRLVLWGWAKSPEGQPPVQGVPTIRTVTLEDNGKSISFNNGDRFLLKLGNNFLWNVQSDNQTVVSRVVNIMATKDSQGVYVIHNAGNATLTGVGDPLCRTSSPQCELPSILFKAYITASP